MKHIYILLSLFLFAGIFQSCSQGKRMSTYYPQDDLYYTPGDDTRARRPNSQADKELGSVTNPNSGSAYRQERSNAYGDNSNSNTNGDTYINNNTNYYYNNDYPYTTRIRRYYNPGLTFGYYDPFYNPYSWGNRSYIGWNSYSGWNFGFSYGSPLYCSNSFYNPYYDPFWGPGCYDPWMNPWYRPYNSYWPYYYGQYNGFYDPNYYKSPGGSTGGGIIGRPVYNAPRGTNSGGNNIYNSGVQQNGRVKREIPGGTGNTGGNNGAVDQQNGTNRTIDNGGTRTAPPANNTGTNDNNGRNTEYAPARDNRNVTPPANNTNPPANNANPPANEQQRDNRNYAPSNNNTTTPPRNDYRPSYTPSQQQQRPRNNTNYAPQQNNNSNWSQPSRSSSPTPSYSPPRQQPTYTPRPSNGGSRSGGSRSGGSSGGGRTNQPRR